ncbi:MAG: hypothetical protein KBT75_14595, partial [Oleispira antarctica]|nr:hypothetical protein [Oleispira antarctica]MBQ0794071.1 hypothetical protein [Oleispira antarctica]
MNPIKIVSIPLLALVITACGGGNPTNGSTPVNDTGTGTGTGTGDVTSASGRNVTFLPLSILETSSDYSGFDQDNVYVTERFYPFIDGVLLSMYNAKTLDSQTGTIDDFVITESGQVVDPLESFPVLQAVGAIPTFLHTAIVIDVSGSVKNTIFSDGLSKVVSEAKAIIAQAKNSSDPVIAKQRFTIWAFGGQVKELTPNGFTEDKDVLNPALDRVLTESVNSSSNLNRAIIEAVGRFTGDAGGEEYSFLDNGQLGNSNNDLIEGVSSNRIQLSSLILITSGTNTTHAFTDEQVKVALESQSRAKFKTSQAAGIEDNSVTENSGKPFIVVLVGNDESTQPSITDNANNIIDLRNQDTDSLNFASSVVTSQQDLINKRKHEGLRYLLRYASPLRQGVNDRVISTGAVDTKYSLTTTKEFDSEVNVGMPWDTYIEGVFSSVEITAANDRYLQNFININDTNVFYPATRWTNTMFINTDYEWQLDGNALTANTTTGAVTVNASDLDASGVSILTLTNKALTPEQTTSMQLTSNPQALIQIFGGSSNRPLTGKTIPVDELDYIDLNASAAPEEPEDPQDPPV